MMAGSPALFSGDFETAAAAYAEAVEDVPEFPMSRYVLGLSQAGLGDWDAAIAGYEASLPDLGLPIVGGPMAYALARRGDTGRAEAVLEELGRLAETHYVPPTKIATAWLGLQDKARALEWLGRALDVRDDRLVYLAVDPHFRELHGDPAFRAYADRVGVLDVLRAGQ
jgi:tetratricopeptide (TPR) repeat protein